jgi:hypothetical protein
VGIAKELSGRSVAGIGDGEGIIPALASKRSNERIASVREYPAELSRWPIQKTKFDCAFRFRTRMKVS